MKPSDVLSMLGLAQRGRRLLSGQDVVEREMKVKEFSLIIIAENASDNTKKRFCRLSEKRGIPFFVWGDSKELGRALGKEVRTVIGITDKRFSAEIHKRLNFLTGVGDIDENTRI